MSKMSLSEFNDQYFYKTQLQHICAEYGVPTYGTKEELNNYIRQYLSGTPAHLIRADRTVKRKKDSKKITLNTKIIGENFSFNAETRRLFADYFRFDKFSFKKEMAIIKRQAERDDDRKMTVQDLLDKYDESQKMMKESSGAEERTYEWNNFVRDFCSSLVSNKYSEKLKVAAILWKHVKARKGSNSFEESLVNKYENEISGFQY